MLGIKSQTEKYRKLSIKLDIVTLEMKVMRIQNECKIDKNPFFLLERMMDFVNDVVAIRRKHLTRLPSSYNVANYKKGGYQPKWNLQPLNSTLLKKLQPENSK